VSTLLSKNLKIKIYRTIILPVVLYGCEAWSLTLREGRRLKVFENRVLRRVFGPKRDEVTGEWRKLHNNVCTGFWWGSLRERDLWGDPDVDGRRILRGIFRKWEGLWGLNGVGSG
jgi:hypothetical protein